MSKRHRLYTALLALILMVGLIAPAWSVPVLASPAVQESPCNPSDYIDRVLEDTDRISEALSNFALQNATNAAETYYDIAQTRRAYEDQSEVPSCAAVLHNLVIQWLATAQDEAALILAIYADRPNTETYSQRRQETNQRMIQVRDAAVNEIERLRSSATQPPPASDWYRVYFTRPINSDNEADHNGAFIERALIFLIDNTQSTIDAALYELNAPQTTEALLRALNRGVQVRLVVDDEAALEDPESTIQRVIDAGAEVISDDRSALMHHKFFIFDSLDVWTGSTNITRNGLYNNNNNAILIRSRDLATNYQAEFNEMFVDREFTRTGDTRPIPNQPISIAGTPIETYFSPEGGRTIVQRIIRLADGANSSIRVMAFSFTLRPVADAMINAMQRGVRVEAVFETTGSLRGRMPDLYCAGASVRQDGNPDIMHHKVIIVDEQTVILGSFNFSGSARDDNSENVLIIQNPDIAGMYTEEWNQRFAEGRDVPAGDIEC